MSAIIETGIDYSRLNDIKYMRSYLMRLNDDLKYMLTNLGEDNLDTESLNTWEQYGSTVLSLSKDAKQFSLDLVDAEAELLGSIEQQADSLSLYLTEGDVTSAVNLSTDAIVLSAERLKVVSDNFTLDGDDLTIKGEIVSNAGNFGGFEIAYENGQPYLNSSSGTVSGGTLYGSSGSFRTFTCAGTDSANLAGMGLEQSSVYLQGCNIDTSGMVMDGDMYITGDLNAAEYNYTEDTYGERIWLYVDNGDIHCEDIIKCEKNIGTMSSISDAGWAQCYSLITSDGSEYSDKRLKTDIEDIPEETAVSFIRNMRPVNFNFKDDPDKERSTGFIAQEVMKLQEEYGDYGLVVKDEDSGYYGLNYGHIIPLIAAAMQKTEKLLNGSD